METRADILAALRKLMALRGLGAYIVPSSDPHQSEYVPEFWQRRRFLSGFTGSAGDVVVTRTMAGLWTDSRYHLQAAHELDLRSFTLFKLGRPGVPAWQDWAVREMKPGSVLGVDPRLITQGDFIKLESALRESGKRLKAVGRNLVDLVWKDRPPSPKGPLRLQPARAAGESVASKLSRVRDEMRRAGADIHVLSRLDDIAWLFNIRGSDVPYNPVAVAYALVGLKSATLFIDPAKVTAGVRASLRSLADIRPYDAFEGELGRLAGREHRVLADEASTSRRAAALLGGRTSWHFAPNPASLFKAVKNAAEIRGAREAHLADGAALVRFLCWLDKSAGREPVTELSAERKLLEFRRADRRFRGPSFRTISAFGPHAAVVHHAADEQSDLRLGRRGFYLIDSGGHYPNATTDVTRTVHLGRPTAEEREAYTRVLKGLISLSATPFPAGTSGRQVDALARLPLWERGWNYSHGTGHGVGAFLSVHEGPQAISPVRCRGFALEPGMITSIEPGFYREGRFGVRLENLALTVRDKKRSSPGQEFLAFETLTLCPIDTTALDRRLLTGREVGWLNSYHDRVRQALLPLLARAEKRWLMKAARRL